MVYHTYRAIIHVNDAWKRVYIALSGLPSSCFQKSGINLPLYWQEILNPSRQFFRYYIELSFGDLTPVIIYIYSSLCLYFWMCSYTEKVFLYMDIKTSVMTSPSVFEVKKLNGDTFQLLKTMQCLSFTCSSPSSLIIPTFYVLQPLFIHQFAWGKYYQWYSLYLPV